MAMSPEQWELVKDIYEAALECAPRGRIVYVHERTTDDVVRAEVLRLLSENDAADGNFLSIPAFVDHRLNSTLVSERLMPGEVLSGRFRIVNFIAAGGMGEVYKAKDLKLDRIVALKFLPKELSEDRESLERFLREAKAASALNHPSICTVYDFGEDTGRSFIAMEYLEGETLAARIQRGPLSTVDALKIAIPIAAALGTAHRKRIVHRDLKPGNIMLTESGAMLLDFGLAKYERHAASADETLATLTSDVQVVGTLPYMSPEQLLGSQVDERGDIFAFGAVLYEMLTGKRAFQNRFNSEAISTIEQHQPTSLCELAKDLPMGLDHIVQRCLRMRPEERFTSMEQVERELQRVSSQFWYDRRGIDLRGLARQLQRPVVAVPALLLLLLFATIGILGIRRAANARWARNVAVPQIERLIKEERLGEAYLLATRAEQFISHDPALDKLWQDISWSEPVTSSPPGAAVYRRDYNVPGQPWELIGHTPIENHRFPLVDSVWKFDLPGYATVERATFPNETLYVKLEKLDAAPPGMVLVQLSTPESPTRPIGLFGIAGYEVLPTITLTDFWLDKFEVTNAQFKQFVDAGGYQKQQYWRSKFCNAGRNLSWTEAMKLFRDKTGKSGPSTWSDGMYREGQDDYPVTGVSWFEAAAYAEFAGKSLPTIYHWKIAASPWNGSSFIPLSNFASGALAPVGTNPGVSWTGAYDLAGNAKEWIWNEAEPGKHYILGGAWNEPTYLFFNPDARSSFERAPNFGFRCAKYLVTPESAKAAAAVKLQGRDFLKEKPVSEAVFRTYRRLYAYEKTPLHAIVESSRQTSDASIQKITFDAAYGGERIIAYLFLPKTSSAPFQTIVYFPGAGALHQRSSFNLEAGYLEEFDFILKSGRAVMFPVYKGTFDRWDNTVIFSATNSTYRDHVIAWSRDLGRSIDYLETRPDIDHNRLAYEGSSWGAAMGALLPAMDDRFKALVLLSPGFYLQDRLPEVDQLNLAPRVKAPVLMLNGRFDFLFPTATSQEPMFRLLGTPAVHKKRVVYDTGHDIPRAEMIKETLNWLDRYLGPANRTHGPS